MRNLFFAVLSLFAAIVALAACASEEGSEGAGGHDASFVGSTIITVGGDFAGNGILTKVELPSLKVTVNAVAGVTGGDPVLRAVGEFLYIVDRFGGDTVTILDRSLQFVGQVSTGAGSNPQDVAVIGDFLYVVLYANSKVLQFDRNDLSAGARKEVDLSALDPDGNANCASIYAVGDNVYVTCQLLEPNFDAKGPGVVVVLNSQSLAQESVLTLNTANPISFLKQNSDGDLLVSTALNPADFDPKAEGSGCLEKIVVGETVSVADCEIANAALGGYISEMDVVGDSLFFINSIGFGRASFHKYKDGMVTPIELPGAGDNVSGIVACPTGELVIADNTVGARGLRVYRGGQALHSGVLEVGWPTVSYPVNGTICW